MTVWPGLTRFVLITVWHGWVDLFQMEYFLIHNDLSKLHKIEHRHLFPRICTPLFSHQRDDNPKLFLNYWIWIINLKIWVAAWCGLHSIQRRWPFLRAWFQGIWLLEGAGDTQSSLLFDRILPAQTAPHRRPKRTIFIYHFRILLRERFKIQRLQNDWKLYGTRMTTATSRKKN